MLETQPQTPENVPATETPLVTLSDAAVAKLTERGELFRHYQLSPCIPQYGNRSLKFIVALLQLGGAFSHLVLESFGPPMNVCGVSLQAV